MTNAISNGTELNRRHPLWLAIVLNLIWINASEVFRYFVFVMPMMRDALSMVPEVAPMNLQVFLVWGLWDTILVVAVCTIAWLAFDKFGFQIRTVLMTATGIWGTIFVILWLGLMNMNLATPEILLVALPLAWLEMLIATFIVRWSMNRQ
jgi:hypothetical protein